MTLSSNVSLWMLPEDGGEPIHIDSLKEIMISECEDPYTHETIRMPHVEWFFTFKAKPSIEELAPRYFKKNNEKNLTCVWTDRRRVVGMLRDLDRWEEFVRLLKKMK